MHLKWDFNTCVGIAKPTTVTIAPMGSIDCTTVCVNKEAPFKI